MLVSPLVGMVESSALQELKGAIRILCNGRARLAVLWRHDTLIADRKQKQVTSSLLQAALTVVSEACWGGM